MSSLLISLSLVSFSVTAHAIHVLFGILASVSLGQAYSSRWWKNGWSMKWKDWKKKWKVMAIMEIRVQTYEISIDNKFKTELLQHSFCNWQSLLDCNCKCIKGFLCPWSSARGHYYIKTQYPHLLIIWFPSFWQWGFQFDVLLITDVKIFLIVKSASHEYWIWQKANGLPGKVCPLCWYIAF